MKIIIFLFLFYCINNFNSYGQFILEVNSLKAYTCMDSTVKFTAKVTDGLNPITDVDYKWSFGDGSPFESGLNLDTTKHAFTKGGGYIIRVDAIKGIDSDYFLYKFEVALTPNFSGTNSDRKDPFCLGQQVFLTGKIADSTWTYKMPDLKVEENPSLISNSVINQTKFDYRIFNKTQAIATALDIDTIGINLEHSNLSDLKIELVCPNGSFIILKDFGGPNKYFGEPIIGGNPDLAGIGYNYYWTNSPDFGTMNAASPSGSSLPSGSYAPEQTFDLLAGCPLNGEWILKITDNQAPDSGFVFLSQIKFESSLLPAKWEYKHTYSFPVWKGSGVSSTSSSGLATAIPQVYGNHRYTFNVKDNFGCPQDTSVYNTVEAPTFTTDSTSGPFNLVINFDNTTSWKADYIWDFGDGTNTGLGDTLSHTYTKEGKYWAHLTAITDDGCQDTAQSVLITVTIPPSSFEDIPNVFTPNGDGKNDVFKISESSAAGIETFNCWIYSRWGKKIAEWNSIEDAKIGWDGNFNGGQKASPGIYYYVLKAKGFDGIEYEKKGSVQLFR